MQSGVATLTEISAAMRRARERFEKGEIERQDADSFANLAGKEMKPLLELARHTEFRVKHPTCPELAFMK